jgi:hypothetical protein
MNNETKVLGDEGWIDQLDSRSAKGVEMDTKKKKLFLTPMALGLAENRSGS